MERVEWVGLWILGGLFLAALLVVALGGRTLGRTTRFAVEFGRTGELKPGAAVHLYGRGVGRVVAIALAPKGGTRVTIEVDRAAADSVHEGNEFFVGLGSRLLGEPTLDIGPPVANRPLGPVLPPGAVVRGTDPPPLDHLLSRIQEHLTLLVQAFREQREDLVAFLESTDRLLGHMAAAQNDPQELVRIRTNLSEGAKAALDLYAAVSQATEKGARFRSCATEVTALWDRIAHDWRSLGDKITRAQAGSERMMGLFPPEERMRARTALQRLLRALSTGQAVLRDTQALMAYVQSGRGTVGALLQDTELIDDVKEITRKLKDRPWLGVAKPKHPRPE